MIVADTNLIVYYVLEGDRSDAASGVRRRDPSWVAPPLWASECRNALVQHVRHGRLALTQARGAWGVARALVRDVEVDPLAALDAAHAHGLSGYDAEFVALAEALGVPLVTDDRRVLTSCPGLAVPLDAFGDGAHDGESSGNPSDAPGPDTAGR